VPRGAVDQGISPDPPLLYADFVDGASVAEGKITMRKSDIAIPVPCTVDWQKMTPADKGRFCGDCKKVVRDLSKMSEVEATALVQSAHGGDLCVRFLHDRHGKVFFEEDLARRGGLIPRSFLVRARRTAVAAASLAVPAFLQGCSSDPFSAIDSAFSSDHHDQDQEELQPNMGGVAMDPNENQPQPQEEVDASPDASPDAKAPPATDAGPKDDAAPSDPDAGVDGGPSAS
jgi:hypothetical protein